jgi:DNA-binding NarL/FixJ family response regulator
MTLRVLVADDNPVIRSGLVSLLEAGGAVRVVAEASNGKEALRLAREHRPDVVLLDVRMPVMDGPSVVGPLSESTRVLMLTYTEDPEIVAATIRAGASGYLVHGRFDAEELASAVAEVAAGRTVASPAITDALFSVVRSGGGGLSPSERPPDALTQREIEVMDLLAKGRSNGEIAGQLFLADKTVKNHINRLYAKLGVRNRAEAIAVWLGTSDASGPRGAQER